jgi:hypothetical protein
MASEIRAELVGKVREAIAAVGWDAGPDLYAMAEAAIDALGLHEEEVVDFTGGAEVRYVTDTYPLI